MFRPLQLIAQLVLVCGSCLIAAGSPSDCKLPVHAHQRWVTKQAVVVTWSKCASNVLIDGKLVRLVGGFAEGSAKPAVNQTIEVRYDPDCGKIFYAKFLAAKPPPPTFPRIQFYILDSVFPKRVKSGDPITVAWTSYAGHSAIDWIGLYPVGASNSSVVSRQYTGAIIFGAREVYALPETVSGLMTFTAPATTGQYEFRYFFNDGSQLVALSRPFGVNQDPIPRPDPAPLPLPTPFPTPTP
jgi:hypothetical protein